MPKEAKEKRICSLGYIGHLILNLKNRQLMHFKLEVLAVLPQWCLGKLKEVVHLRQTHACAINVANVVTLRNIVILPMAVDSRVKK